jgi:CDP-glycerol glycerophosphotransferase (TagB/SpsB family)
MKKILFHTYSRGNIEALASYYEENLKGKYDIKLIMMDYKSSLLNKKIPRYLYTLKFYLGSYDMIVADYPSFIFKRGKEKVFISHGYGTKKTPGNDELNIPKTMKYYKYAKENIQSLITLSERDKIYYMKSPYLKEGINKYIPLGLPRVDNLYKEEFIKASRQKLDKEYKTSGKKIILFAPTWRGYVPENKFPLSPEDIKDLDNFLGNKGYKLIYRPHYFESLIPENSFEGCKNIIHQGKGSPFSAEEVLAASDILMTDYSSIYVDFLVLQRPIIFIPFDKEQYDKFRGLAIDFAKDADTPGPKINNLKELQTYIEDIDNEKDDYKDARELSLQEFYKYNDGKSTERVWDFIINKLEL